MSQVLFGIRQRAKVTHNKGDSISELGRLESVIRAMMGGCWWSVSLLYWMMINPLRQEPGLPVGQRPQHSPGLVRNTGVQATLQSSQSFQLNVILNTAHAGQARVDTKKNAVGVMVPKHIIGFYDSVSTWRICICSAPSPIRRQVPLVLSVQTPHLPPQHSRGILRGPHGLLTRCSCCLDLPEWGHQS